MIEPKLPCGQELRNWNCELGPTLLALHRSPGICSPASILFI